MATKRKRIPQHLEYAIEDIEQEMSRISRLASEANEALTDPRGVNKYLLMTLVAKTSESVANIARTLDRIERREGPPTNGAAPAELTRNWVEMVAELIDNETPYSVLAVILNHKKDELT